MIEVLAVVISVYGALQTSLTLWLLKKTAENSQKLDNGLCKRMDRLSDEVSKLESRVVEVK